jgi:hypothetical protein
MTTFQRPQPLKAALKIALFGPAGAGTTFTALLLAEGLARDTGKRVAVCDTEQGTAFYGQEVPQRSVHPAAFDFDVLHSRSITEVLAAVRSLDAARHGVLVVDSITHLWDACKAAYGGRLNRNGAIPFNAWTAIKKPYRELMHFLLSTPMHVIICGRQGVEYGEDEATGELAALGYKMRAEGETAYDPDLLLRLEQHRPKRKQAAVPTAFVEKDRTGLLAGKSIEWPQFDNVAKPLLPLLGPSQVAAPSEDEVGMQDAEALARDETEKARQSVDLAEEYMKRFGDADGAEVLQGIGRELTPGVKARLTAGDLVRVRQAFTVRLAQLQSANGVPAKAG